MTLIYSCILHVYMHQPQLMKHVPEYTFNPLTNPLNIKNIHQILILLSWQKSVMVSQHQNLCIYSSKDPKKVPESTNKLCAQEALRPYLGAKEAKAQRALSQISLPTESILYNVQRGEGERCRCPVRINGSGRQRKQAQSREGEPLLLIWLCWHPNQADTGRRFFFLEVGKPSNHTCIIIPQVHGTYFRLDAEPSGTLISSQGVGNNKQTIATPAHFHFCCH